MRKIWITSEKTPLSAKTLAAARNSGAGEILHRPLPAALADMKDGYHEIEEPEQRVVEQTADEKIAALRAEFEPALNAARAKVLELESVIESERAKVEKLETLVAGNGDATAPDARTRLRAIEDALKAKDILSSAEIDAHLKSSYRDNGDGTVSRLDRFGLIVSSFDPTDKGDEQTLYATWLSMGGKPLPADITAIKR